MVTIQLKPEELQKIIEDSVRKVLKEYFNETGRPEEPDKLLNIAQAARFLQVYPSTIYDRVYKGKLPVIKRGKRWYFSLNELKKHANDF